MLTIDLNSVFLLLLITKRNTDEDTNQRRTYSLLSGR